MRLKYKVSLTLLFLLVTLQAISQNKSGYTWIIGSDAMYASFSGDTSRPITGQRFSASSPYHPYLFVCSQSNICDSSTGQLKFMSDGMRLYDTLGNIMENGDSLQPHNIYMHNCCPAIEVNTEGSMILPKGSNGLFYVLTPTITDSAFTTYVTGAQNKVPYDLLQYHIVDANANGGLGKVIQKNMQLLANVEMCKTGMMACRHANGYDWWLLKQALDTNMIYTFLVTADTIELKLVQGFTKPKFGYYDLVGQSCFSTDGSKYAFATGGGYMNNKGAHLFITDFDRCTGVLSNLKEAYTPYDSTLTSFDIIFGPYSDSLITGIAFSENDSFLYVTRRYNIYQYDLNEPDSLLAWVLIQHGPDTTASQFVEYGQLLRGIDNRIYIGKSRGANGLQNSVIDHPNSKGAGCGFCRKCLRYDTGIDFISSPPNMPDFNLGKKEPCWPLSSGDIKEKDCDMMVYPNPTSSSFTIELRNRKAQVTPIELYNILGQLIYSKVLASQQSKVTIDMSSLPIGVYYLRCQGISKKIIKE